MPYHDQRGMANTRRKIVVNTTFIVAYSLGYIKL